MVHSFREGLKYTPNNTDHYKAKKINQLNKNGDLIKSWDCIKYAETELNIDHSKISMCCTGKRKTAGGFKWEYKK